MKRIIAFILLVSVVSNLFGCNSKKNSLTMSEWDLKLIGYFDGWDKNIPDENYIVGFIDIDSTVKSDDGTYEVKHIELLESVVRRISSKCRTKIITLSTTSSVDDFMSALLEMIDNGIKVINISLGTTSELELSDEVMKKIQENDVILVCAAGNNTDGLMYPAQSEGTISILACDIYGKSNKKLDGTMKKSYTMPGLHINLLDNYFSGTSLSAVYFSVICAAYMAMNPNLSDNEVLLNLKNSCQYETEDSYGIIQMNDLF